jgi:hypothetical protein
MSLLLMGAAVLPLPWSPLLPMFSEPDAVLIDSVTNDWFGCRPGFDFEPLNGSPVPWAFEALGPEAAGFVVPFAIGALLMFVSPTKIFAA